MQLTKLLTILNEIAPLPLAEQWDNPGLLVEPMEREITTALVALDCTVDVVHEAKQRGAQIVLAHHPLFFKPVQSLYYSRPETAAAYWLAHYGIDNLGQLQRDRWMVWVEAGSPLGKTPQGKTLLGLRPTTGITMVDSFPPEPQHRLTPVDNSTNSTASPIALVSARPLPPYGQSIYENLAGVQARQTRIQATVDAESNVIPIPVLVDSRHQGIYR